MTSERRREFALLQLVGAAPRQVRGMMRWESLIALGLAAIVGTVIAYPPLAGIAVAVSGMPFPTVAPAAYGVIAGGTTLLGFAAITVTARQMVRRNSQSRF
jgi:putative ABC transport system permease protein